MEEAGPGMGAMGCHLPGVQWPGGAGAGGQEVVQSHRDMPVPSEERSRERHRWRDLTSEGPGGQGSRGRGRPQMGVSILGDKQEDPWASTPWLSLGVTSAGGWLSPHPLPGWKPCLRPTSPPSSSCCRVSDALPQNVWHPLPCMQAAPPLYPSAIHTASPSAASFPFTPGLVLWTQRLCAINI